LATYYLPINDDAKKMAAPQWVTEGLRSVVLGAIFSSYASAKIRAILVVALWRRLQPMPRKPHAVTKQF
jgi:hypothetical protein